MYPFLFGDIWNTAYTAFQKNMGLCIGAYLLWILVSAAASYIPLVNVIVDPPLICGMLIFALKVIRDENPQVGDIFSGFNIFGVTHGAFWALLAASLLVLLPGAILMVIILAATVGLSALGSNENIIGSIGFGGVLVLIAWFAIYFYYIVGWTFAFYIAIDKDFSDYGFDALKKSVELTKGIKLQLFGCLLLLSIIGSIGVLACGIGVFFTMPLAQLGHAAIYNAVKQQYMARNRPQPNLPPSGYNPVQY